MAYAVLRTAKLKTAGNIGGLNAHLIRAKEVPNADKELIDFNSRPIGSRDLWADVQNRIAEAGITKLRKDGVLAVEHLMTASPEHFGASVKQAANGEKEVWLQVEKWNSFQKASIDWLKERYGEKNLVNVTCHLDEQTPHIHAIVVPIDQKGKLNCKSFLGGREKLRDMQSSFAQVHQAAGLERGIEGSQARHTTVKDFYAHANAFEKAPVLDLTIASPKARLEAPETILRVMLEGEEAYVARQEKRLNQQWKEQHEDNLLKAQQKAVALHKAAQASEVLKLKNKSLEGQLKGLEKQVGELSKQVTKLSEQQKAGKFLLECLVQGKASVPDLKEAIDQVPTREGKQTAIRQMLQAMDIQVKQPEVQHQQKKSKGIGR